MSAFPTIKLQNGVEMPIIGLGTWQVYWLFTGSLKDCNMVNLLFFLRILFQSTDDDVRKAVEVAVAEAKYPLIDTAEIYQNEEVRRCLILASSLLRATCWRRFI